MKYLAVVGGATVFKAILTRRFRAGISPQKRIKEEKSEVKAIFGRSSKAKL